MILSRIHGALLLLGLLTRSGVAQEVFIHAENDGAGLLRPRGSDCLVIAPSHVVGNADSITLVADLRVQGSAELLRRFPGDDLALLRVANTPNLSCREWRTSDTLNVTLRSLTDGVLKRRRADGGMAQMPVYVIGYNDQTIEIAPRLPSDAIVRTMSGSTLYLGGELAGMLDSVSGTRGIVARIDRMYATMQSFLAAAGPPLTPNDRIRTTTDHLSLGSFTIPNRTGGGVIRRASLTMTIENRTREPVRLALERNGQRDELGDAKVSLSDDLATTWFVERIVGLEVVSCCSRNVAGFRAEEFTVIGPGARVRVLVVFADRTNPTAYRGYTAPIAPESAAPTTFSFTADALYYTTSVPERFSIQLPSIQGRH